MEEIATIAEDDRKSTSVDFVDEKNISLEKKDENKTEENISESEDININNEKELIAEQEEQEDNDSNEIQNKHLLGKFDSVESLENAYKSLQAEFTRKSQELANLKRQSNVETTPQESFDNINEFANQFDDENLLQDISQIYLQNESLLYDKFGLTKAVYQLLSDKISTNMRNLESEDWLFDVVSQNSNVKEKIINEYIENCAKGRVPPLISKTIGTNLVASTPTAPQTLEEVASVITKWLN